MTGRAISLKKNAVKVKIFYIPALVATLDGDRTEELETRVSKDLAHLSEKQLANLRHLIILKSFCASRTRITADKCCIPQN